MSQQKRFHTPYVKFDKLELLIRNQWWLMCWQSPKRFYFSTFFFPLTPRTRFCWSCLTLSLQSTWASEGNEVLDTIEGLGSKAFKKVLFVRDDWKSRKVDEQEKTHCSRLIVKDRPSWSDTGKSGTSLTKWTAWLELMLLRDRPPPPTKTWSRALPEWWVAARFLKTAIILRRVIDDIKWVNQSRWYGVWEQMLKSPATTAIPDGTTEETTCTSWFTWMWKEERFQWAGWFLGEGKLKRPFLNRNKRVASQHSWETTVKR